MSEGFSCLCPTYRRPYLLEEAVESFLRQDYDGPAELLIGNDGPPMLAPGSPDNRRVVMVNFPRRFNSLGEKYAALAGLAIHPILAIWEDDDIQLPWRLRVTERRMRTQDVYRTDLAFFWNDGRITAWSHNLHFSSLSFRRSLLLRTTGWGFRCAGTDQHITPKLEDAAMISGQDVSSACTPEEAYYVYRWAGVTPEHLSGIPVPAGSDADVAQREKHGWDMAQQLADTFSPITAKDVHPGHMLQPHWVVDYTAQAMRWSAENPL